MVEAGQGWSRRLREGEETTPRLSGICCHHSRPPPLALMQDIVSDIFAPKQGLPVCCGFILGALGGPCSGHLVVSQGALVEESAVGQMN